MKTRIHSFLFYTIVTTIIIFSLLSCQINYAGETLRKKNDQSSTVLDEDSSYAGLNYLLLKPRKYYHYSDHKKIYPFILYLHGRDSGANTSLPSFIGNGTTQEAKDFHRDYPSFVYFPKAPSGTPNWAIHAAKIVQTVEHFKKIYRLDTTRFYIIGYSMGATGTITIPREFLKSGQLFAAIVRMAGTSAITENDVKSIYPNTPVWVHVGSVDPYPPQVTYDSYIALKTCYNGIETTKQKVLITRPWDEVDPGEVTVDISTYTVNNKHFIKQSIYQGVGHGTSHMPFVDTELIPWIFSQQK